MAGMTAKRHMMVAAEAHEATVTGNPAVFKTDIPAALTWLVIPFTPVQDLHGYDSPWYGGGGKNLFDGNFPNIDDTVRYVPMLVGDQTVTVSTTCPRNTGGYAVIYALPGNVTTGADSVMNGFYNGYSRTISPSNGYITIGYRISGAVDPRDYDTQVEIGDTATDYVPYENICPITGWSNVTITSNGINITANFGGTYYGGSFEAKSGELTVTYGAIASYNGETLPGEWISDRDVYAAETTPTTGAQVVYALTEPQTVQLDPVTVRTIAGQNSISTNTNGTNTVIYLTRQ